MSWTPESCPVLVLPWRCPQQGTKLSKCTFLTATFETFASPAVLDYIAYIVLVS